MAQAKKEAVQDEVQVWLDHISKYDREFKEWGSRVDKILKRYRDEKRRSSDSGARFSILWSNVQTLIPATFSRVPQPDVSRRFRDNDPVGRVASLILERALDFEIQHYPDYEATMRESVLDRFLGGRATAWVRYEPHIKAKPGMPAEGSQVTEDADADADQVEELDYECAPTDYVHWKDFGHVIARTWEEVPGVWRIVYMNEDAVMERFGEEIAKKLPYDSLPQELKKNQGGEVEAKQAKIYEIWNKDKKCAYWLHKSFPEFLDEKPDPLGLEGFFPCAKPLYATLTNDSLIPVPDYTLYQDQARDLDLLSDRIDGLVQALKVMGTYDASVPELARLFTEGVNGTLIPVKNWQAFVEKNGLAGAISLVDLKPIAEALRTAYEAFQQIVGFIYQITGIADIVRGQTDPDETLGAQQLKGQFASIRLRDLQRATAKYATDLIQLKAQVMCLKFSPETLLKMSAADQLSDADKQYIQPALALLVGEERMMNLEAEGKNPLRSFRIEVNADTLVQFDENAEKQNATDFLTAVSTYMEKAAAVGMQAPQLVPLLMELLKWGVQRFKVGKTIEGTIDQAIDELKKQAAMPKPPPPPDPHVQAAQIKAQATAVEAQTEQHVAPIRAQAEQISAQASVMKSTNELRKAQVIAMTPQPPQPGVQ